MAEPTEEQLRIPHVVAARFARPGTDRYEELVASGNLGLVEALRSHDPAKGPLVNHIFARVRSRVQRSLGRKNCRGRDVLLHERRWQLMRSIDAPMADGLTLAATLAEACPSEEAADAVEAVLSKLDPVDRELYTLRHGMGLGLDEISARFGWADRRDVRRRLERVGLRVYRLASQLTPEERTA